ncbi:MULTISPECIES: ABC transporter ATP-binding protein [Thermoanaerobacterium]|uniref:ABC transporter n=2 Tax=Thermoanaerobacterium TaxID=28895 RepID=W9E875_9THEO|nr:MULTISPECIES: ABC transporter ATP-binding protein [Thermoanaerobacterium]AFK85798.1 ABC transporter related protein [Thermoanaerobacterium saccharolyticum JW/SL-YS485]ETO37993.1 ABC transporter [Thermoanaerobacterium aotearoense SCUT27]
MKAVKFERLTKRFGDLVALDNVNLEIEEGEIYGFLGPNGAGKSTAINIICGLLKMDSGKVYVMERDIKREPDFAKMNIGVVPQDIAIYGELSAYENVSFFASLYGLKGRELKESVDMALEFVGLQDKANWLANKFSGGMKRRLNIACAIAHKPKIIILDEPTVGIDPQSRNHILESVKKLNEMGSTVIYTSHYMEEVEAVCTKISIIDHGKIIAEGTKEELKSIITDANTVMITVTSVANIDENKLKAINGVKSIDIDENTVKIVSYRDVSNLDKIIHYFTSDGIAIKNIETQTPDLETVFLTLTGRKLRD